MRQSRETIDASNVNQSLLSALQLEVDLGAQALKRGEGDAAVTFFQSALQKMTADMPFYDHLVHNLLLGYKIIIEDRLAAEDFDMATRFLQASLSLEICGEMANDSVFLQKFADNFQAIGLLYFKCRRIEESLLCCRKAIAVYPNQSNYVNLTNALTALNRPAVLADFTKDLTPEQLGRHIFIACVPKSASTFLKDVLVSLTGYNDLFAVYAAGQSEHELYLPSIRESAHLNTVTQQHCRASDANVNMMQAFGISPVVLVRNIFDSVMSLLDFYNNQGAFYNSYSRADFMSHTEETKIDLLIDTVIPWYFQFVSSWDLVEKQRRLAIKWLTYEDLIADKTGTLQDVLKFYGLGAPEKAVESKVKETESEAKKIRFNKGVAGRGTTGLTDLQKERIRRFSKYYPTTDFGRIGL